MSKTPRPSLELYYNWRVKSRAWLLRHSTTPGIRIYIDTTECPEGLAHARCYIDIKAVRKGAGLPVHNASLSPWFIVKYIFYWMSKMSRPCLELHKNQLYRWLSGHTVPLGHKLTDRYRYYCMSWKPRPCLLKMNERGRISCTYRTTVTGILVLSMYITVCSRRTVRNWI